MGASQSQKKTFDKEKLESYKYEDQFYDEEVARLPSLDGKVVAITGTTTGLGYHLALAAVKKGVSRLLLLNRDSERAQASHKELADVAGAATTIETINCDLMSFASVRECAQRVKSIAASLGGLDVLANNAGVMAFKDTRTVDGYEVQMQTNQLSHVLLTHLLFSELEHAAETRGEARVVFHSSGARNKPYRDLKAAHFHQCEPGTLGGDDNSIFWEVASGAEGPWGRYHHTKLANSCFAMAMHDRLSERGSKVKVLGVAPGLAASNLQVTSVNDGLMSSWFGDMLFSGNKGQSAGDGACSIIRACFDPETNSGDFIEPAEGYKGRPKTFIKQGVAIKGSDNKLTVSKKNKDIAWNESIKVLDGGKFFPDE